MSAKTEFLRPLFKAPKLTQILFPHVVLFLCYKDFEDHLPRFKICLVDTPKDFALEVDADLTEWDLNVLMSTPAYFRTSQIQFDNVHALTGECGLI